MNVALDYAVLPARLRFERPMTDDELFEFCVRNDTLRVERDSNGELILMSPSGLEGDNYNVEITTELTNWARLDGRGKSSVPMAASRSPMGRCEVPTVHGCPGKDGMHLLRRSGNGSVT
jgi:Uma2 family endonuclease